MTAVPPTFTPANGPAPARLAHDAIATRWAALADAANLVAVLAGLEPELATPGGQEIPVLIRDAEAWRRERAENGVADLAAIMEAGLAALLAVNARGANPQPAAMALWREFVAARAAVLALLPPDGARPPGAGA
jgi:hypothetical protein